MEKYINMLYDVYKENLIRLCSSTYNFDMIDVHKIKTPPFEIFDNEYDKWVDNISKKDNLFESITKNGMYWILFIYKDNRVKEGQHRIKVLQERTKEYKVLALISNNYLISEESRRIEDDVVDVNLKKISYIKKTPTYNEDFCNFDNIKYDFEICKEYKAVKKNFISLAIDLRNILYLYNKNNSTPYETSLLCNNYECLKGAVDHYKETGEFILDNKELIRRFTKNQR